MSQVETSVTNTIISVIPGLKVPEEEIAGLNCFLSREIKHWNMTLYKDVDIQSIYLGVSISINRFPGFKGGLHAE